MRPAVKWAFAISAATSLVSLVPFDGEPTGAVFPNATDRDQAQKNSIAEILDGRSAVSRKSESASHASNVELPERLPIQELSVAERDPFDLAPPPVPPMPPVVSVVPAPSGVLTAPERAKVPPMNYRYLGQMTDPSGQRIVYLMKAEREIRAAVGSRLDDGYIVDAITVSAVSLTYPEGDVRVDIGIPPLQDSTP